MPSSKSASVLLLLMVMCIFHDTPVTAREFTLATGHPACTSYPVASEEECKVACKSLYGANSFSAGEWDYWPGCFYYKNNQNCHWNRNGAAQTWQGNDHWNVCVKTAKNVGEGCWKQCDKKHGKCPDFCGTGGLCCRYGKSGNECDGSIGVDSSHHKCTADQRGEDIRHSGQHCWNFCNKKDGSCSYCGPKGKCCRLGYDRNGCDGKTGGDGHHLCTGSLVTKDKSWMGLVDGEKGLHELSIPGTHDSCAENKSGCSKNGWVKCQDQSLTQQLNMGVRYFDIRLRHTDNKFMIHHGSCYVGYKFGTDVLNVFKEFLKKNPTETILMSYQKEHDDGGTLTRTFQDTLQWYLDTVWDKSMLYTGTTVPKLKDVRGKMVMINFGGNGKCDGSQGLCSGKGWNSDYTVENTWEPKGDPNLGWFMGDYMTKLRTNMDNSIQRKKNGKLYITFLSAARGYFPKSWANYVNKRIHNYLLEQGRKAPVGIVVWDFIHTAHARLVYNQNWL